MTQADMLSINTVAAKLGLSVHQLRRWELMFGLEIKRGRGQQRQYRPEDLTVLERIKELVEQGWPTSQIRPQLEAEGLITPKLIGVPQQPGNPEMLMEAIIGLRSFSERRFIEISKQIDELRQLMISITLRNELKNEMSSPWQPVEEEFAPMPQNSILPPQEISIGPNVNVTLPSVTPQTVAPPASYSLPKTSYQPPSPILGDEEDDFEDEDLEEEELGDEGEFAPQPFPAAPSNTKAAPAPANPTAVISSSTNSAAEQPSSFSPVAPKVPELAAKVPAVEKQAAASLPEQVQTSPAIIPPSEPPVPAAAAAAKPGPAPAPTPSPSPPAPAAAPQVIPRQGLGEITDQNYLTVLGKALDMIGWTDEQADQYSQNTFGVSHWDELGRSQAEKLISHLLEQMK